MKCRLASRFGCIDISFGPIESGKQHLRQTYFAGGAGPVQRRASQLILRFDLAICIQQQANYIFTPVALLICTEVMQDIPSSVIGPVDICTSTDQQVKNMPVILPRSRHQRSATLFILCLRRCSVIEQDLHDPDMVPLYSPKERRRLISLDIGLCALTQQKLRRCDASSRRASHEPDSQEVIAELPIVARLLDNVAQSVCIILLRRPQQLRFQTGIIVASNS